MAKRRFRSTEEAPPEELSPEERRARRRRDRELAKRGKKPPTGRTNPWRRAGFIAAGVAVLVAVLAILVYANPFAAPCVAFSAIPTSAGQPEFPLHNTTDFDGTWCPANVATVATIQPYLTIEINGQRVGIPPTNPATATNPDWPSIGRNSSYANSYACDLPIQTRPPDAAAGLPDGVIDIVTPWAYSYNLSDFFHVWSVSFSSVSVNATDGSQPIVYQSNDLLGFTADATHRIDLFVDGAPSSAGPGLVLNTLDYVGSPYPSCLAQKYGTGHQILLTYSTVTGSVRGSGLHPVALATAPVDPLAYSASLGGPLQKDVGAVGAANDRAQAGVGGLLWLALRVVPA